MLRKAMVLILSAVTVVTLGILGLGVTNPLQVEAQTQTIPYLITEAIPTQPAPPGGTFFTTSFTVDFQTGTVVLSQSPDGTGDTLVDDAIEITVTQPDGSVQSFVYVYVPGGCGTPVVFLPPQDITSLFGVGVNQVTVRLYDVCGSTVESTSLYLVNLGASLPPAPTPTLQPESESPPTWFEPGDDRVDGQAGDRIAVYCDPPGTIRVWGVDENSQGFPLTEFQILDILLAGPTGVIHDAPPHGSVSINGNIQGYFWVVWNGGTGSGEFAKEFQCAVEQAFLVPFNAPRCPLQGDGPDGCYSGNVDPLSVTVVFINGIDNDIAKHENNRQRVERKFPNDNVMGIYNAGLSDNLGLTGYLSDATNTLINYLTDTSHQVTLVCHSQGGAVCADALRQVDSPRLDNIKIITAGSPVVNWVSDPSYCHLTFVLDPFTVISRREVGDTVEIWDIPSSLGDVHSFDNYANYLYLCQ